MKTAMAQFARGFQILIDDPASQCASLVIGPGRSEGGPQNRHRGADQWIFVVRGEGEAQIAGQTMRLKPGFVALISRGDAHGFTNTGQDDLALLTFYVPPAYDPEGNELPAGLP